VLERTVVNAGEDLRNLSMSEKTVVNAGEDLRNLSMLEKTVVNAGEDLRNLSVSEKTVVNAREDFLMIREESFQSIDDYWEEPFQTTMIRE
jgi:uncharacterized protein YkvS